MNQSNRWWQSGEIYLLFIVQIVLISLLVYGWFTLPGNHWPSVGVGIVLSIPLALHIRHYRIALTARTEAGHKRSPLVAIVVLGWPLVLYILTTIFGDGTLDVIAIGGLIGVIISASYGMWHIARFPLGPDTTIAHALNGAVPLAETALRGAIDDPSTHTAVKGRIAEVDGLVAITGWVVSTDGTVTIEQIEVWIDGARRRLATTDVIGSHGRFTWQWDTTDERPGIHTVVVRVMLSTGQTVLLPSARYPEYTHVLVQTGM